MLQLEEETSEDLITVNFKEENVDQSKKYKLLDSSETLLISDAAELEEKLGITREVLVCCIVGKVGDGKSHTLNAAFLNGKRVFETDETQDSCTKGVWAAYNAEHNCVFLDTEGLSASNDTSTLRLLLKVMSISDVVIYQTRAPFLHDDVSEFLRNAYTAFNEHFLVELKKHTCVVNEKGPSVIVFHEPQRKDPHKNNEKLRKKLEGWQFALPTYVGIKTPQSGITDFEPLQSKFKEVIDRTTGRQPHGLHMLLEALKILNKRFVGEAKKAPLSLFTEECLRCEKACLVCRSRCKLSVGHDGEKHKCESSCKEDEHQKNVVFLCKTCHAEGKEFQLLPANGSSLLQYAWSGEFLKCSNPACTVEYQSRKYWYGNPTLEEAGVALPQARHVWIDNPHPQAECINVAQQMLDVLSVKTQVIGEHIMDCVNPSHFEPNSEIKGCARCDKPFTTGDRKHHCRVCGKGVCDACSSRRRLVPEKSLKGEQRVCDKCYDVDELATPPEGEQGDYWLRSAAVTSISIIQKAVTIPRELVKGSTQPRHWIPDSEAPCCDLCQKPFNEILRRHHCRSCGRVFCDHCSRHSLPISATSGPVRICDRCEPHVRRAYASTTNTNTDKK